MRRIIGFIKGHWRGALASLIGLLFLVATPYSFTYGQNIQKFFDSVLHLRVDPKYSGGESLAVFRDSFGDDKGAGALEYPIADAFQKGGCLDLVKYAVHKPVVDKEYGSFWQLDVLMAEAGPSVVHIYINTGGSPGASTQSAAARSELVAFDPEHPWDFFVEIDFKARKAFVKTASKGIREAIGVFDFSDGKGLAVRVPLSIPEVERILDKRDTWHYVFVGAYDEYASGHFMKIQEISCLHSGGGSVSALEPRVYDYLAPKGIDQARLLSSYDEASGALALVKAIKVDWNAKAEVDKEARIAALEAHKAADSIVSAKTAEAAVQGKTGIERAIALFQSGDYKEATFAFDAILAASPEEPRALAYKGALVAMKGGNTQDLADAVRFVNEGFAIMDRAVVLSLANGSLNPDPWICRGSVCLSVPEMVFNKSAQGAQDFGAAASWFESAGSSNQEMRAQMLVMQGIAYERANKAEAAELCFIKAASLSPKGAALQLELVKRGYMD